jgi:galactonate dehydratase
MSGNIYIKQIPVRQSQAVRKPVAFHGCYCSGPVTLAVSTHLAMACSNVVEREFTRGFYYGWYHECVDQLPPLGNGFIRPPERHGLGLSLAADILTRPDAILRTTEA